VGRDGAGRLRASVEALTDEQLDEPRMTNWGEEMLARWVVQVMVEHDLYHAGEINHIRSLSQRTDHWLACRRTRETGTPLRATGYSSSGSVGYDPSRTSAGSASNHCSITEA
jgi:hypothetical protein